MSPSSARRARTSARWPATSGQRWGSVATSPRCGARASARSRSTHARTLEALEATPSLSLTLDEAVAVAFPRRDADAGEAADLAHGRPLPPAGVEGIQGVFAPDGHVLALVRDRDGRARPVVVLAPA